MRKEHIATNASSSDDTAGPLERDRFSGRTLYNTKKRLSLVCLSVIAICLFTGPGQIFNMVGMAAGGGLTDHAASAGEGLSSDAPIDGKGALSEIDWSQVSALNEGSSDVLVAILDTGVDRDHEDLVGRVVDEVNLSESPVVDDLHGHGSHVAGIIAADADNGIGIDGVAPNVLIMNVKVTDDRGRCDAAAIADGILRAVDSGATIVNISLRLDEPSQELEEAVAYAWSHGALIVAAAGNNGGSMPQYPAYYNDSIAVTAIRDDGSRAPLANYGEWVDVAAPGYQIYSTLPGDEYGYKTGTSQATAHVTGLAALLYGMAVDSDGDGRVNDEVRAAIEASCLQADRSGMGNGIVNPVAAVTLLQSESNLPQYSID
jgi:subtilisin family serine protease